MKQHKRTFTLLDACLMCLAFAGCIYLIAAFFGSQAFAAPIPIKTANDLASRTWPDGTELRIVDGVKEIKIAKPVQWNGKLIIDLNCATLDNPLSPWKFDSRKLKWWMDHAGSAAFNIVPGRDLEILNGELSTRSHWNALALKATRNRSIFADAPQNHLKLRQVTFTGGYGIEAWQLATLNWIGGGGHDLRDYAVYIGNNVLGKTVGAFYVDKCVFIAGDDAEETTVRIMGGSGQLAWCRFVSTAKNRKGSVQPRAGDLIEFLNCELGTIEGGSLEPKIDGGKHAAYDAKNPTKIKIAGGTLTGHVQVAGNATLETDGLKVLGRDPRGHSPSTAFTVKSWVYGGRYFRPRGYSVNTSVDGFKAFAADGWRKLGCKLNGVAIK